MTQAQARAEVFYAALKSLSGEEREALFDRIAHDAGLVEDLVDLALLAQRSSDPERPFEEYVRDRSARE